MPASSRGTGARNAADIITANAHMKFALTDIGLNLAHDSFDHDRDEVVADAMAAGVGYFVITGSTIDSTRAACGIAREAPERFRATAGIHPHHAREFGDDDLATLRDLMNAPEVGAAGECGLDYFRNFSPHEDQERVFEFAYTTREGGNGLGLAMVHQCIVEEQGGRVELDSRPGEGTVVRLIFPAESPA